MEEDDTIIEDKLSDRAKEFIEDSVGTDITFGAVLVAPIPLEEVEDHTPDPYENGERDEDSTLVRSHLYALCDIARAAYHCGDPILASISAKEDDDRETYAVTDQTVTELSVAQSLLMSSWERELRACADRLDIETDGTDDYKEAIREELGYEVELDEGDAEPVSLKEIKEGLDFDTDSDDSKNRQSLSNSPNSNDSDSESDDSEDDRFETPPPEEFLEENTDPEDL